MTRIDFGYPSSPAAVHDPGHGMVIRGRLLSPGRVERPLKMRRSD